MASIQGMKKCVARCGWLATGNETVRSKVWLASIQGMKKCVANWQRWDEGTGRREREKTNNRKNGTILCSGKERLPDRGGPSSPEMYCGFTAQTVPQSGHPRGRGRFPSHSSNTNTH